jgi:transcriptional regulator with XRE-family HTH domain
MVQLADNAPLLRRIGRAIAHARVGRGWTQETLAAVLEISVKNVQRLESGRHDLRLSTVAKVAAALGMTLDGLVAAQPDGQPVRMRRTFGRATGLSATGWSLLPDGAVDRVSVPVLDLRDHSQVHEPRGLPPQVGFARPPAGFALPSGGLFLARALCPTSSPEVTPGAWCLFRHPVAHRPRARTVLVHHSAERHWTIEADDARSEVLLATSRVVAELDCVLEAVKPAPSAGRPPFGRKAP